MTTCRSGRATARSGGSHGHGEVRVKPYQVVACALFAVAFACGCRANGFGTLSKPAPIAAVPSLDPDQFIARHNREARLITSYQAAPAVTPTDKTGRKNILRGVAHGRLYIEPPRNFRLVLKALQQDVIDVGSNEDQLWIWSKELQNGETVFTCNYDEGGGVPVSGLYQPDWLMEALGLEPLPEPDAEGVNIRKEANGAEIVIEQKRTGADGRVAIKETVLSALNGQISEHRLFQLDTNGKKTQVASAKIVKYERHEVKTPGADEGETAMIDLPAIIEIHWPAEQMDLEVRLDSVELNKGFSRQGQGARKFMVPEERGKLRDLRQELGQMAEPGGTSTVRETRPAPPAGVRLSDPQPSAANTKRPASTSTRSTARPDAEVTTTSAARPLPSPEVEPEMPAEKPIPVGYTPAPIADVYPDWRASGGRPIRR